MKMESVRWEDMPSQCPAFNDGWLSQLRDGKAFIVSNGSKWAGQRPEKLAGLIRALRNHKAEAWSFIENRPAWQGELQPPKHSVQICGNFEDLSHVFSVYTDSYRLVQSLWKRISGSQIIA